MDQYYTAPDIAVELYRQLAPYGDAETLWVEPSAGTGAFFSLLPETHRKGFDLDPHYPGVELRDFLDVKTATFQNWIAIGNPPFGKNSSTAVKFFNHCAGAKLIAMIFPKTFRKASIINRLNHNYHLISDTNIPPNSFIYEGKPYNVPCCFQLWELRCTTRPTITEPKSHPSFSFTTRENANFAIQRVGTNAGKIKDVSNTLAQQSHHFIQGNRSVFEQLNFSEVKLNTAGNPSISKAEIVAEVIRISEEQPCIFPK